MSRLQDLINHLIEMLTLYYTKQTLKPLDLEKYISLPDAELRKALEVINLGATTGTGSIRRSLLEYFRFAITVVRPLINSGRLLSADEETRIFNTLSRLLNDSLRLLNQKTSLWIETNQCGLIELPKDPRSLSYDELDRSLLNSSSYVLFGSTIYYVELDKYPASTAPQSSSSAASNTFCITELKTITDARLLDRLFSPNYKDATPLNLKEIKALSGHEFKTQSVEVKGMYGSVTNTSSTSAFKTAVLAPFGIKETSSETEINAWIKKLVNKHQMPYELAQLQQQSIQQQAEIDSLRDSLSAEQAKSEQLSRDVQWLREQLEKSETIISEKEADNSKLKSKLDSKTDECEKLQTQHSELVSSQTQRRTRSPLLRVQLEEKTKRTEDRYASFFGLPFKPMTIMPEEPDLQTETDKRMQYGSHS